jgi:hypothetical protein
MPFLPPFGPTVTPPHANYTGPGVISTHLNGQANFQVVQQQGTTIPLGSGPMMGSEGSFDASGGGLVGGLATDATDFGSGGNTNCMSSTEMPNAGDLSLNSDDTGCTSCSCGGDGRDGVSFGGDLVFNSTIGLTNNLGLPNLPTGLPPWAFIGPPPYQTAQNTSNARTTYNQQFGVGPMGFPGGLTFGFGPTVPAGQITGYIFGS